MPSAPVLPRRATTVGIGIDKQDDAAAERLQRGDGVLDDRVVAVVELPALLRGEGAGRVGHQRALLRAHLAHDLEQPLVGIALDVQLATRPPRPHQLGQRRHVAAADMALVGTRMHGQPVGAGIVRDAREAQHIGHPGMPRVAQQRDLVEVDAQSGHRIPTCCAPGSGVRNYRSGPRGDKAHAAASGGSPSALGSIPRLAPFAREGCSHDRGAGHGRSHRQKPAGSQPGPEARGYPLCSDNRAGAGCYSIPGSISDRQSDQEKDMPLLRYGLAIVLAMGATACGVGAPQRASDIQNVNAISDDIAAVRMTQSPSRALEPELDGRLDQRLLPVPGLQFGSPDPIVIAAPHRPGHRVRSPGNGPAPDGGGCGNGTQRTAWCDGTGAGRRGSGVAAGAGACRRACRRRAAHSMRR